MLRGRCWQIRLPSHEEVRQASEKGPYGHDETSHSDEPGPVQLGPKMADHSEEQQVAWRRERQANREERN